MTANDQQRPPTCAALNADGEPCQARPLHGSRWCWHHDESVADARAEARRQGGVNRAAIRRIHAGLPDVLGDTRDLLVDAMEAVAAGRMPAARGQALASIARAIVAVHVEHEVEDRIAELERRIDDLPAVTRHLTEVRS